MALIKCPECKKKVSDTVSCCPKCGFSIVGYLSENRISQEPEKNLRNKIKYFIISAIAMLLILLSFFGYINADIILNDISDEESSVYPLFGDSITTANDLLGKEITPILNGYIKDEDYTITAEADGDVYTFWFDSFVLGTDPNLILYVDNSTSKIIKVHYSFRVANGGNFSDYSHYLKFSRISSDLTDYYDVDPIYTYLANKKQIKVSKDKFANLADNKKTTFYVTWESTKGKAVYSLTNLYEEKKEYGTLTFIKNF